MASLPREAVLPRAVSGLSPRPPQPASVPRARTYTLHIAAYTPRHPTPTHPFTSPRVKLAGIDLADLICEHERKPKLKLKLNANSRTQRVTIYWRARLSACHAPRANFAVRSATPTERGLTHSPQDGAGVVAALALWHFWQACLFLFLLLICSCFCSCSAPGLLFALGVLCGVLSRIP